jgi:DUF4097 and DUF4098 domain-containing protein YvlB
MVRKFLTLVKMSVVLISLLMTGCTGFAEAKEEFRETYAVESGAILDIANKNGDIRIQVWDKDQVEVYALKSTMWGRDELKKVDIKVTTDGGITIETDYLSKTARVSVDYDIRVPAGVSVRGVETANGEIEVEGVAGDVEAATFNGEVILRDVNGTVTAFTSNGDITITGAKGVLDARTSNGDIRVEIASVTEDIDLSTSNGSIDVYVSPALNADVELRTSNGGVDVSSSVPLTVRDSSKKRVTGQMGSGGPRITAVTSNGDVDLRALTGK